MYIGLLHTHSDLRYLILALLLFTFLKALLGWISKADYKSTDNRLAFWTMLLVHLQIVVGFVLYFLSPKVGLANLADSMKDTSTRYYTVEHISLMLLVALLISLGRVFSKKKTLSVQKHKTISIYYGMSLVIILLTVYVMMPA